MKRIIAGGTGFIGQYLVNKWLAKGIEVTIIGRSCNKIKSIFGDKVNAMTWSELPQSGLQVLSDAELILNLTGANIGEKRWSDQRKQVILDSRIETTKIIGQLCSSLGDKSPPWFNASAVGVYGLDHDGSVDESTPIDFDQAPDFLSEVGRAWEAETHQAKAHGVRVVNLRFGVVLGSGGGVLSKLSIPFKLFIGGPVGSGKQAFPWIHIQDLAQAIEFLLQQPTLNGPFNLVAPQAITQKQLANALGHALKRPSFMPTPGIALKLAFGQMADELLLQGQEVEPKRLTENNFEFQFSSIDAALSDIFRQ